MCIASREVLEMGNELERPVHWVLGFVSVVLVIVLGFFTLGVMREFPFLFDELISANIRWLNSRYVYFEQDVSRRGIGWEGTHAFEAIYDVERGEWVLYGSKAPGSVRSGLGQVPGNTSPRMVEVSRRTLVRMGQGAYVWMQPLLERQEYLFARERYLVWCDAGRPGIHWRDLANGAERVHSYALPWGSEAQKADWVLRPLRGFERVVLDIDRETAEQLDWEQMGLRSPLGEERVEADGDLERVLCEIEIEGGTAKVVRVRSSLEANEGLVSLEDLESPERLPGLERGEIVCDVQGDRFLTVQRVGGNWGRFHTRKVAEGSLVGSAPLDEEYLLAACFANGGKEIQYVVDPNRIRRVDAATGRLLQEWITHRKSLWMSVGLGVGWVLWGGAMMWWLRGTRWMSGVVLLVVVGVCVGCEWRMWCCGDSRDWGRLAAQVQEGLMQGLALVMVVMVARGKPSMVRSLGAIVLLGVFLWGLHTWRAKGLDYNYRLLRCSLEFIVLPALAWQLWTIGEGVWRGWRGGKRERGEGGYQVKGLFLAILYAAVALSLARNSDQTAWSLGRWWQDALVEHTWGMGVLVSVAGIGIAQSRTMDWSRGILVMVVLLVGLIAGLSVVDRPSYHQYTNRDWSIICGIRWSLMGLLVFAGVSAWKERGYDVRSSGADRGGVEGR